MAIVYLLAAKWILLLLLTIHYSFSTSACTYYCSPCPVCFFNISSITQQHVMCCRLRHLFRSSLSHLLFSPTKVLQAMYTFILLLPETPNKRVQLFYGGAWDHTGEKWALRFFISAWLCKEHCVSVFFPPICLFHHVYRRK